MRIFDRIKAAAGILTGNKEVPSGLGIGFNGWFNSFNKVTTIDHLTGYLAAVINKRVTTAANIETEIYINGEPAPDNHWLRLLFGQPNLINELSITDLKQQWYSQLDFYGNAYIYTPLLNSKIPSQLWTLPSQYITLDVNPNGINPITGYKFRSQIGNFTTYPFQEVCHLKTINTLAPSNNWIENIYLGYPDKLYAALNAVLADEQITTFIQRYMERDAFPPYLLKEEVSVPADITKKFLDQLRVTTANKTYLGTLPKGTDLVTLTSSGTGKSDNPLNFSDLINIKEKICAIFGVPIRLLTSGFDSYASSYIDENAFLTGTIENMVTKLDYSLTNHFQKFETGKLKITHKPLSVQDPTIKLLEQEYLLKYGIKTRNEIRLENGLDTIEGGDEPLVPTGFTTWNNLSNPIQIQSVTNSNQLTNNEQPVVKSNQLELITKSEDPLYLTWKSIDTAVKTKNTLLAGKIKKTFKSLQNTIKSQYKLNKKSISFKRELSYELSYLFDLTEYELEIVKNCSPELDKIIEATYNNVMKNVNSPKLRKSEYEKLRAAIAKESYSKMKIPIKTIDIELKDKIQTYINDNPLLAESELKNGINNLIDYQFDTVYTKSRTDMIARTTTTFTANKTQNQIADKYELDSFWLSQRDSRCRDAHANADGQKKIDGKYTVGGESISQPGEGSSANAVNCRCYQLLQEKKS